MAMDTELFSHIMVGVLCTQYVSSYNFGKAIINLPAWIAASTLK